MADQNKPEWNKFGSSCGGSRWFKGKPETQKIEVKTFTEKWFCPACEAGEMKFDGFTWPTGDPGYHHTCDCCGFRAAVKRQYPRIIYIEG